MAVTGAIGLFARPEAKVEAQLDQVGNMTGFWVGGGDCHGHDGLDDDKGDSLASLDWKVFNAVGFKMTGEASVQYGLGLGRLSGGFLESGRPSRRCVTAITPHA